jgi:molybdopterin synthase catalytic subunit
MQTDRGHAFPFPCGRRFTETEGTAFELTFVPISALWEGLGDKKDMNVAEMVEKIKVHPAYAQVGMILCHVGVVRSTSRDGREVSGLDLTADYEVLEKILAEQKARPGIVEILVEIAEGPLTVGDEVMILVVAGDLRDRVIPVLEDTLNAIKKEVTHKTEHFV